MAMVIREAMAKDFDAVGNVFLEELQFHATLLPDRFQVADPIMTRDWYQELLDNAPQGISEIELHVWERNTGAIVFYKRLGYEPLQRRLQLKLE